MLVPALVWFIILSIIFVPVTISDFLIVGAVSLLLAFPTSFFMKKWVRNYRP